jgi:hypothetical protein
MSDDLLPLEPTLKTFRSSDDSITEDLDGESSESLIIDTRTVKPLPVQVPIVKKQNDAQSGGSIPSFHI